MNAQRLIFALLLCTLPAGAQPWRATVEGPRGLPSVEVSLGYPHGLVSTARSPITLRIRSGRLPFDGYVGFHIGERKLRTVDSPVITRVRLGPNAEQRFETWARMRLHRNVDRFDDREIVIEWRNRSLDVIAKQSAGVPPWQRAQPLRLPVGVLGTTAQWYAGFSSVETSTDQWFALPLRVREAIFRSTLPVVFAGAPSRVPEMTAIDRALFPVEFRAEAATVDVPWPYSGNGKQLPVRVSWTPDAGTNIAGDPRLPYIAANSIAVFAADERALREGLPSFARFFYRGAEAEPAATALPGILEVVHEMRPLLVALLVIPLSVAMWFLMRRRPRFVVPLTAAAAAVLIIAARDSVEPLRSRTDDVVMRIREPNVVEVVARIRYTGLTPLRTEPTHSASVVTPVLDAVGVESRPPSGLPGTGETYTPFGWTSTALAVERRELGRPASIRVRPDGHNLVVDYESTQPVDFIQALWICGTRRCRGIAAAGGNRGSVVIRHNSRIFSCLECRLEDQEWRIGNYFRGSAFVSLISRTESGVASISQIDPPGSPARDVPFTAEATPKVEGNVLRAMFALPPLPQNEPLTARLQIRGAFPAENGKVVLAGEGGAATLAVKRSGGVNVIHPIDDLRTVAPRGGVVVASIEITAPPAEMGLLRANLVVARKR